MEASQNYKDYVKEAQTTASNNFYGDRVKLADFNKVLLDAIQALSKLDKLKKVLFYGVETQEEVNQSNCELCSEILGFVSEQKSKSASLVHGVIGLATESGELLEQLYNSIVSKKQTDEVNLIEEMGDCFWYIALISGAIDCQFDVIQRKNIAKLQHRYPEKFKESDAKTRDIEGERIILETTR